MPETTSGEHDGQRGRLADQISTDAVQLFSEYTGRGPTKVHTIINRNSFAIVLRDTLTKGERSLVEAGRAEEVLRSRHAYQDVMREELTNVVEQATQRKVIAFMSDNHIDPDAAVEFFLLEPEGDGGSNTGG
jgi:uncharacterized protein YbcI